MTVSVIAAEPVLACQNRLGEGPIWSIEEQALYWVDIVAPAIHRFRPADSAHDRWPMPEHVGSLSMRAAGGLVVALKSGFALFEPASGAIEMIALAEADLLDHRFNDGRCDRQGRFFAGSLTYSEDAPVGSLWRLDADRQATPVLNGITISNGLCWSPDGATMYHVDTPTREIRAFDYDQAAGMPGNPRVLVKTDPAGGWPDGSITDSEGCIWNAEWDARAWCATRRTARSTASSRFRPGAPPAPPSAVPT
ncbi:MAG: SMP-30/gluconolactonase/LRE family protein [Rhizobiales bacterium]|nr:SMP-30/gluconolactonase/LRE family protein [Hyphomicrobiales bacterium]